MKKNRVTALAIAVLMVVSMLAGTMQVAFAEKTYEIVMQWPSIGMTPLGMEAVEAAANERLAEIGCTLVLEPVNAFNLANETSLAVSSGEKLDISLSLFTGIGALVSNGSLLELDDLLVEYGQDILATMSEAQLTGGLMGDHMYAIPINYVDGNDIALNCRKDILDKYSIEIDSEKYYTFDELEEIFATIKAGEGSSFYMVAGGLENNMPYGALYNFDPLGQTEASGVLMIDGSGSTDIVNMYATDEYREFADRMYRWNQAGYFSPDASTTSDSSTTLISAGNYFGCFSNYSGTNTKADFATETGYECVSIRTKKAACMSSNYTSVLWSIPATSENPQKAMQFLNMLYKDNELTNLLRYGIEDVSYVVLEDNGTAKLIDFPEGQNAMSVPYYQIFGVYGNRLDWYVQVPNAITMNDELRAFNDTITESSPALGYSFDVDKVSAKYSAVSAVVQQYTVIVGCGAIDPAQELPEFLNALEKAGINEVIAENQKQLNEWLASK